MGNYIKSGKKSLFAPAYYHSENPVAAQVTKLLLMMAGDVEVNPGPLSPPVEDSLTRGLALLISQAGPEQVKLVISTRASDKTSIVEDLNKFKVPALKEALVWLDLSDQGLA